MLIVAVSLKPNNDAIYTADNNNNLRRTWIDQLLFLIKVQIYFTFILRDLRTLRFSHNSVFSNPLVIEIVFHYSLNVTEFVEHLFESAAFFAAIKVHAVSSFQSLFKLK